MAPYTCCKQREVKQYVCILCGAVYHASCMERYDTIIKIDETRVNCCSPDFDVASVLDKNFREKFDLMKELLDEMRKRNKLLKEKIELLDKTRVFGGKSENTSYAGVVAGKSKVAPIVIKPKTQTEKGAIMNKIKSAVNPNELKISVETLKEKKDGSLIIRCNNEKSNETMKNEIAKIENLNCDIDTIQMKNPRLKIVNVIDDSDPKIIADMIAKQNFDDCNAADIKLVYVRDNKRNNTRTIFLELPPDLFSKVMREKVVYIGWQRCRCFEDYNLSRCFNCSGYGHSSKRCQSEMACQFCAGNHDSRNCQQKTAKKCANCARANAKYKTNKDENHCAYEIDKCDCYEFYQKRVIANTRYN